jgi:hypothetical protein
MPVNLLEDEEFFLDLLRKMVARGFIPVGFICYRPGVSDNETVKVACPVDFYQHPKMRPIVIRMLRNAATILEAGGDDRTVERI